MSFTNFIESSQKNSAAVKKENPTNNPARPPQSAKVKFYEIN
jgi:hypothetical protein